MEFEGRCQESCRWKGRLDQVEIERVQARRVGDAGLALGAY